MLSLQNSKTSSAKEDRKEEEDYNDYPANFIEMQGCNCFVSLLLSALANLNRDSGSLIPTQQLDTLCRSLICPQSRMLT